MAKELGVGATFPDIGTGTTGTAHLRAHGPVAVIVWRTDCPTCRLALPFWQRLYETIPGAQLLGVCQETDAATREFARRAGITFPQISDEDEGFQVTRSLGAQSVPTFYLVSTDGTVIDSGEGWDGDGFQRVADCFASAAGVPSRPVIDYSTGIPRFKPG